MLLILSRKSIAYTLESSVDQDGFWDKTQQMVLNTFKFAEEITKIEPEEETEKSSEKPDIILLEEIIE